MQTQLSGAVGTPLGLDPKYPINKWDDVQAVWKLLRMIPSEEGGPDSSSAISLWDKPDGNRMAPLILTFQNAHRAEVFGEEKAGGRIMPGADNKTLPLMEQKSQAAVDKIKKQIKAGDALSDLARRAMDALSTPAASPPATKPKPDKDTPVDLANMIKKITSRPASIKLVSNRSVSPALGAFGATLATFTFQQGSDSRRFVLTSAGVGKGLAPGSIAFSTADMRTTPLVGDGVFSNPMSGHEAVLDDLSAGCVIYTAGGACPESGEALTLYCLGLDTLTMAAVGAAMASSVVPLGTFVMQTFLQAKAFLLTEGEQRGTPDIGISWQGGRLQDLDWILKYTPPQHLRK